MSLDFDYSKIDAEKYPDSDDQMNPITNALVWHTLNVGFGQPENDPLEWVFRVTFWEKAVGPHLRTFNPVMDTWDVRPITVEELLDHTGLHTNVSKISRTEFMKRVANFHMDGVKYSIKRIEENA